MNFLNKKILYLDIVLFKRLYLWSKKNKIFLIKYTKNNFSLHLFNL